MTTVRPIHATLILVVTLCHVMKIGNSKASIPILILPRLSGNPFLFQIINRELNICVGFSDSSDVAGRYLISICGCRIEVGSILVGSHYIFGCVIKIDNRIGRTHSAGLNRTLFIRSKEVIIG